MDTNKKRRLARHVDGRIMVGSMPLKPFLLKFLPTVLIFVVLLFLNLTPGALFFTVIACGGTYFLFSEVNNKETGLDSIKSFLLYKKQGTLIYERSAKHDESTFRYIRHKARYEKDSKDSD